jgi:hypothetical protein
MTGHDTFFNAERKVSLEDVSAVSGLGLSLETNAYRYDISRMRWCPFSSYL